MKVTVDLTKLEVYQEDAENIVVDQKAEESIVKLYELRDKIDAAIKTAKEKIKVAALAYNKDFKSITSNKLRIMHRAYGARYSIDQSHIDKLPKELYSTTVRHSPKAAEIDRYAEDKGLPLGIIENKREPQLQITVKK